MPSRSFRESGSGRKRGTWPAVAVQRLRQVDAARGHGARDRTTLGEMTMALSLGSISGRSIAAHVSSNSRGLARIAARISSGRRINSASDDAASLGVSSTLDAKVLSTRAAMRNSEIGLALVQVVDSAAGELTSALQRMRELAVQASSSFVRAEERTTLDGEFAGMRSAMSRIAASVEFSGLSLADGSTTQLAVQAGVGSGTSSRIVVGLSDLTTTRLGLNASSVDLLSATNARSTLDILDLALSSVSQSRSRLGATVNRLEASLGASQGYKEALAMASSRLLDADYAKETSEFTKHQILMVASGAALVHHKHIEHHALRLLG